MNADFVFITHLLRSLGLPIYAADIHPPRRGSRPYVAALHLRQYQAIVFEDGHDFFTKHQQKIHLIYQVLSYLLGAPFGHDILLCGTHDGLTEVGLQARDMGIEVVFIDLNAMACDEAYQDFVAATLKALSLSKIPTYLVPSDSSSTVPGALLKGTMEVTNDLLRMLGPLTLPIPLPEFVTPLGIDLCELHAYTKGLVGRTVSALGRLKALMVLDDEARTGGIEALERKGPLLNGEVTGVAELAGVAEVGRAQNEELDARSSKQQGSQRAETLCVHRPKTRATSGSRFETYLKPVADETLGSWLSRNACSPTIKIIHDDFLRWCTELVQGSQQPYGSYSSQLLGHAGRAAGFAGLPIPATWVGEGEIKLVDEGGEQLPWDPAELLGSAGHDKSPGRVKFEHDTLYRSPTFLDAFPAQMQHRIPIQFSLPGDATHPRENRKYCAQCIADDVAAFRAPALRRAWRKRGAAVCTYHSHPVLLQRLDSSSLSELTGSWLAYSQHTQREAFDHGTGMIRRSARGFQEVASECRICRIVGRIQNWVENSPAQPTATQPSKYALYFLLGYFLYQPNSNSAGGIARWFFRSEKGSKLNAMVFERPTVRQLMENIETGSPKSLAMAYLLVGCAFKLIGPREHGFLKSVLTFTDSPFPSNRAQIKTLAQCFQEYHCVAMWESAQCNLSEQDLIHVEWLLKT